MRKIREVLRLKYEQGRSHRQIAGSCGIGMATVSEYLRRARDRGVGWAEDITSPCPAGRRRAAAGGPVVHTRLWSRSPGSGMGWPASAA